MMAYSLRCMWRTLADLQSLAVGGKYGKQRGIIRPFQALNAQQLQEELRARNIYHTCTTKRDLQKELSRALKGVQRVPTLLLDTPQLQLQDTNLHKYCILDCEPLHDIKGHLINIFTELPYAITHLPLRKEAVEMLNLVVPKEKPSCGDYRRAAIRLLALLKGKASTNVCTLLSTVIEISEILYSLDDKRNTTTILRLHNLTWLHHELCRDLFSTLHKLGRQKMFGLYLHALTCHAPKQYEIMCLRSCNAENEERLFGQAKAIALHATNRQPGNVLPTILLRLQVKLERSTMFNTQNQQSNTISRESRLVHKPQNTKVSVQYICNRLDSWQAHLEDLSCYLIEGENVWWKWTDQGTTIEFLDVSGDGEQMANPMLPHYRATGLKELKREKEKAWKTIIDSDIPLPTTSIKLYDDGGNFLAQHYQTIVNSIATTSTSTSISEVEESTVDDAEPMNDIRTETAVEHEVVTDDGDRPTDNGEATIQIPEHIGDVDTLH